METKKKRKKKNKPTNEQKNKQTNKQTNKFNPVSLPKKSKETKLIEAIETLVLTSIYSWKKVVDSSLT